MNAYKMEAHKEQSAITIALAGNSRRYAKTREQERDAHDVFCALFSNMPIMSDLPLHNLYALYAHTYKANEARKCLDGRRGWFVVDAGFHNGYPVLIEQSINPIKQDGDTHGTYWIRLTEYHRQGSPDAYVSHLRLESEAHALIVEQRRVNLYRDGAWKQAI